MSGSPGGGGVIQEKLGAAHTYIAHIREYPPGGLVEDTESVSNLFAKLDLFRLCSGLEFNRSKTEALWLGLNKNRTDTPFGIRWPKDHVNALGICFTTDQNISYSKDLESRLLSLEKCLNVWSSRDLTLYGKINIVKSLAKLTFVASVLPIPDDFIKKG